MDPELRLQPVRVATSLDGDGVLVFVDDRLVARLVQFSDAHEELGIAGNWYMETKLSLCLTGKLALSPISLRLGHGLASD